MRFDVITIFPEMFATIKDEGVIARAIRKNYIKIKLWQLRDFAENKYRNIDDKPYGGGAGMVMQVKPIRDCINKIRQKTPKTKVIYLSPQGEKLTHNLSQTLAKLDSITLLCGRYEGIDERIIEHDIDLEVSIGDYIISGGELAAMVLIDTISRQIPKVITNPKSLNDSFTNKILDHPHYTRPETINDQSVPKILLSGNPKKITQWQTQQALKKTHQNRPDLLKK